MFYDPPCLLRASGDLSAIQAIQALQKKDTQSLSSLLLVKRFKPGETGLGPE